MNFFQWILSIFGVKPAMTLPQWQLTGFHDGKPVLVGAGPNYGGAIYYITWGGNQLVNQAPANGGQMQTAYYVETPPGQTNAINPTEAGNWTDHVFANGSPTGSTTVITGEYLSNVHLQTICHPAYWSGSYQGSLVSPDNLGKTVTLRDNVIDLQYTLQFNGNHPSCGLETAWYMPNQFTYWHDSLSGANISQPLGQSNNANHPIIANVGDGSLACALYCTAPNKVYGFGYDQQYPKINIYFPNLGVITNGQQFNWEVFAVFGTLSEVTNTLRALGNQ